MSRIERNRGARIVLLLCAMLAAGSVSFGASVADAGPLEGLTGPVGEAAGAPVQEVTETVEEVTNTVTPPVQEVTGTAPPPVVETTEAVVPPVKEAAEAAVGTTKEATHAVIPPTATSVPKVPPVPKVPSVRLPAVPAGVHGSATSAAAGTSEAARGVVAGATKQATHTAGETLGDATGSGRPSSGGGSVGASAADAGEAPGSVSPPVASPSSPSGKVHGDGIPGREKFRAPSTDGSVRAPVPKWVAYIWPAIALTRPDLASFLTRWEEGGMRALLATATDGEPTGSHGVAGAHASHDAQTGASDSSSSPFSGIPSAIGGVTSQVPGEAWAYLIIVAILVAAVFGAIKLEIARHGQGSR